MEVQKKYIVVRGYSSMAERFYLDFSYTITTADGTTVSPSVLYCINIQKPMNATGLNNPWRTLGLMLASYANNGYEIYIRLYRKSEAERIMSVIEIPTVIGPFAPNTIYPDIMVDEENEEYTVPAFVYISANYNFILPGIEVSDVSRRYICNFNFVFNSDGINEAVIGASILGGNSGDK